jgi:hypothetical protein
MNIMSYIGIAINIAFFFAGLMLGMRIRARNDKKHKDKVQYSMIPPEIKGPVSELEGTDRAMRISRLITGYIMGTLTPEEHDELDEWVGANEKNMRLFEELTDPNKIEEALKILNENQVKNGK